jgi:taurine dioxygenase
MPALIAKRSLAGPLGLEVRGWDLKNPLTAAQAREIAGLLYQYALLCFCDQELAPADLEQIGNSLGNPVLHNEETLRLEGTPGVMSLSNADERDERQLNGGAHWHTDLVYTEEPASFTMLHAVAVPRNGGGTMFANQVAAYDMLPKSTRQQIEGLTVVHCYEGRTDGSMPQVRHPLVRRHPVTGRKALYGVWDTGIGIVGMPDDEGRRFLARLARHATNEQFVYLHRYKHNDFVIWDNAQLLHSAEKLERARNSDDRRIMHRVSVRGWPSGPEYAGAGEAIAR